MVLIMVGLLLVFRFVTVWHLKCVLLERLISNLLVLRIVFLRVYFLTSIGRLLRARLVFHVSVVQFRLAAFWLSVVWYWTLLLASSLTAIIMSPEFLWLVMVSLEELLLLLCGRTLHPTCWCSTDRLLLVGVFLNLLQSLSVFFHLFTQRNLIIAAILAPVVVLIIFARLKRFYLHHDVLLALARRRNPVVSNRLTVCVVGLLVAFEVAAVE